MKREKNTSQSDLNGQNYPEGDELIKAKDIQFNEFPPLPPRKTKNCRSQPKLSTILLAIFFIFFSLKRQKVLIRFVLTSIHT